MYTGVLYSQHYLNASKNLIRIDLILCLTRKMHLLFLIYGCSSKSS
jgi:hypothetical protein